MLQSVEYIADLATPLTEQYLNAVPSSIKQIEGRGDVNEVYEIASGDHRLILRINTPTEIGRYKKEQWCIDTAYAKGVPTPKVFTIGSNDKCAYMLLEYISGANGKDLSNTTVLWEKMGKQLRNIHSIEVAGFGENLVDINGGSPLQWQDYCMRNIRSLEGKNQLVALGLVDAKKSAHLQSFFTKLAAKNFRFGLNHGDYSLANIIVDDRQVPYVIDWGSAQAHIVPHHDLGVILDESLDENSDEFMAFIQGYGLLPEQYMAMRQDVKTLLLLESVDKLRWALEKAPQRVAHYNLQVQTYLAECEAYLARR